MNRDTVGLGGRSIELSVLSAFFVGVYEMAELSSTYTAALAVLVFVGGSLLASAYRIRKSAGSRGGKGGTGGSGGDAHDGVGGAGGEGGRGGDAPEFVRE